MRFIQDVSQETFHLLQRVYKHSQYYRVRQRAHCIMLSFQGYSTTELQEIFHVDRITIYHWFDAWESRRLSGLYDKKGRGRHAKLSPEQQHQGRQWAKRFPKNLNRVCTLIQQEFGIKVSKDTVKRILKTLQFGWHRLRRRPKGQPDPELYGQKKQELEVLKHQEDHGEIDLFYFDESGFCLVPYLPYAWQERGEPIALPSGRSSRLNILGFMSRKQELQAYSIRGKVTSKTVIDCLNDFCQTVTKKTVIVMDNARIHPSAAFEEQKPKWQKRGVEVFFLPKYSPQLNLIEILWRFMKYEWIDFRAYTSWKNLVEYVEDVLKNFGEKYKINFN